MKSETFIHYGTRLKNALKVYLKQTKVLIEKSKEYIKCCIKTNIFYYSEIRIQSKVFRNNLKQDINRFKN